ncbi:unnamed protein product, partial [Mesorhabditis belari]|uniref:Protein kinase domain-containing protein n=1 Tax=Mesorhabditis belari TaxID=2138241 RepID=A0AAF3ERG2_9BILA
MNRDDPNVAFEHVKKIRPMLEPCMKMEDGKNETAWRTSNDIGLMQMLSDAQAMHNRCQIKSERQPVFFVLTDMNSSTAADKFKFLPDRVTNDVLKSYSTFDILMRIIWTKETVRDFNVDVAGWLNETQLKSGGYILWAVDDLSDPTFVSNTYGLCAPPTEEKGPKNELGAGVWVAIGLGGLLILFDDCTHCFAYSIFDYKLHKDLADEGLDRYVQEYNKGEDVWEIDPRNLHISSEKIGSGAYAVVFKGILTGIPPVVRLIPRAQLIGGYAKDENAVAVKRPYEHANSEERIEFLQEIRFMKTLDFHPHQEESPIDADVLPVIAWQICDALSYLSTKNIIHRDVAARNVLITSAKVAKLSDFGLCRHVDDLMYSSKKTAKLPLKWMAPESIEKAEYSHKSDMWSYGILLYEIFSFGVVPYPTIESEAVLEFVKKGNRPEIPDETPSYIEPMLHQCWQMKPADRPNAGDLKFSLYTQIEATISGDGYLQVQ